MSHRGCVRAGSIPGTSSSDRDPAEARESWAVKTPLIAYEFLMNLEAWLALSSVYTYGFNIILTLYIDSRQRRPAGSNITLLNILYCVPETESQKKILKNQSLV